MIKLLISILIITTNIFAATAIEKVWNKGESFLVFLENNKLPLALYYNLPKEDKELVEEVYAGVRYYKLIDEESEEIQQVLIPISQEIQIHLYKDEDEYKFDMIPIYYSEYQDSFSVSIERSPYQDVLELSGNHLLANEIVQAYKNSVNFKRDIRKNDKFAILYNQKIRLGKNFGSPTILASMIETSKKPNYIFLNDDGKYYNASGKIIENFLLSYPVRYSRISSKFTKKRWHPILKRYRPHLGVDFAAPVGTPIKAAGDGVVNFVGNRGGYGKTVVINHSNGYRTLYAHMHRYAKGTRSGKRVKQGDLIGYVGSTGLSTGPHLHFGLYRNKIAIDPLKTVKVETKSLKGEKKVEFDILASNYKEIIRDTIAKNMQPKKIENLELVASVLSTKI